MAKTAQLGYLNLSITFATTTSTSMGFLPPNAYITDIKVLVTTAFNAGGTDVVDIGDETTATKYADDVDVSSTGSATVTSTAIPDIERPPKNPIQSTSNNIIIRPTCP